VYGTRDELLAEAHRRIDSNPDAYYPHIYGEHEVGGTSMLFLSPVSFEQLGFKHSLPLEPLPMRTWAALSHVPDVISIGGALLLGIWWITKRREEVAAREVAELPVATTTVSPQEGIHDTRKPT